MPAYPTGRQFTPQQYADVLIQAYAQQLRVIILRFSQFTFSLFQLE